MIRPGAIGDFVVSLPALESLRADYLEVWTRGPNVPLARFADRAVSIAATGLDLLGVAAEPPPGLVERLRAFDSIVSWYGANRPEFRSLVKQLGLPFEFRDALPAAGWRGHAVDFYLAQVGLPPGAVPRIVCPPAPRRDRAVFHPFAGSARKQWPLERYRQAAARFPFPVDWCAGPEDELEGAVRFDDLYELACWLAGARVYLGNDSGISHLAAAVGAPVVALFGPTEPALWAPRGPRVQVIAASAMEEIEVERVAATIVERCGR
ncbi:MAG: glycosyltransferase family 9 protein [Bryobacteraceae bacterium]